MARRVAIVPHTHWDREWYAPFPVFRARLVEVLDRLLELLQTDPAYRCFLLDGQMAMVDDYLEVRPEAAGTLQQLAASGRLAFGPWYVLPDEFLVTGETLVRNLQLGVERAARFGGAMSVGYLPDMFGHVAQMPQILRQAGMVHAVVWRGVPAAIDRTAFWWEAPDGSTVRAEYLPAGYAVGADLPDDPERLLETVRRRLEELAPFLVGDLLLLHGNDHQPPRPWLGRVVSEANARQDDLLLDVTSLPSYLATAPDHDLPRWRGELRSGARANLLMGVASNRLDVKQAAARCHRELERRAEPYEALFGDPSRRVGPLLGLAWQQVIHNAAHDSICACSVDEVVDAVLGRYSEAEAAARFVADQALGDLGASLAEAATVVVNPSPFARSGLVEAVVTTEAADGLQEPPQDSGGDSSPNGSAPGPDQVTVDVATARTMLALLPATSRIDDHTWLHAVDVADDGELSVTITLGGHERPDVDPVAIRRTLAAHLDATEHQRVRLRVRRPAGRRQLVHVGPVPGFGWAALAPTPPTHPVTSTTGTGPKDLPTLSNGLVTVGVDPADATFSLDGRPGFGRLVDGGDLGDSYNYSPPATDELVGEPTEVTVTSDTDGPLRQSFTVTATYHWPDHADEHAGRRVGRRAVEVRTTVELRADEPFVRVTTEFTNPCADHRVRVHLPLVTPADRSRAECAFAVVERGLTAEGRAEEAGLPTFPSQRFVQAGGVTVVHDGLPEYELVDVVDTEDGPRAHTLALTVLRATGMLSRVGMTFRPVPAGPLTPVPGLQLLGRRIRASYAVAVADVDPFAMAEAVLLPLEVVTGPGGGWRPADGRALQIDGAPVTAVRRRAGGIEVRLHNPRPEPATVNLGDRHGWLVDLLGRPQEPVAASLTVAPGAIATLWLDEASSRH